MLLLVLPSVLLVPAKCSNITVCIEENGELRVDCLIHSKALKPESYSFFWSSGPKQMLINSNVSGSSVDNQFKGKSVVTERELGYRMNLRGFTENLPQNPTFICRVNDESAQISLGKGGWIWIYRRGDKKKVWERFLVMISIYCFSPCRTNWAMFSHQRISAELQLLDCLLDALLSTARLKRGWAKACSLGPAPVHL